jgi:hypothetical protein
MQHFLIHLAPDPREPFFYQDYKQITKTLKKTFSKNLPLTIVTVNHGKHKNNTTEKKNLLQSNKLAKHIQSKQKNPNPGEKTNKTNGKMLKEIPKTQFETISPPPKNLFQPTSSFNPQLTSTAMI